MLNRSFAIDIDFLERSAEVISADKSFCRRLEIAQPSEPGDERISAQRLSMTLDPEDSIASATRNALKRIQTYPCAIEATHEAWPLSFSGARFVPDLELLASKLSGTVAKVRSSSVVSKNVESNEVYLEYPNPDKVAPYLAMVERLLTDPVSKLPLINAMTIWLFLLRCHPFTDGNGRVARAMINIALRNMGLLSSPKVFFAPELIVQDHKFIHAMTGYRRDDIRLLKTLATIMI